MAYEQNPAVWKGGQWGLMLLISDAYEQDFLQFFLFFSLLLGSEMWSMMNIVTDLWCLWTDLSILDLIFLAIWLEKVASDG